MLTIGFDAKRLFYNQRGLGNYSRDTVRILSHLKPDNRYLLYTPGTTGALNVPLLPNCQIREPHRPLSKWFPSLWRTYGICRDIKQDKLAIYHGLSHELPIGIHKTGTRTVVTMHDLIFLTNPELYPFVDRLLYKQKYLQSCKVADAIVAISHQTKKELIDLASIDASKITVVYQGCQPQFKQMATTEEIERVKSRYNLPDAYLLTVGAVERRKNQELVIKALAAGNIEVPLVIVGKKTDYMDVLLRLVAKHTLEKRVLFLTNVTSTDLPILYQNALLFVYPSLLEGFGIPILEALHSKVPVITSKGSCFAETGGMHTRYIDTNSVDELVATLHDLLDHPEKRTLMKEQGLIHASKFSDQSVAEALFSVYESLL